MRHPLSANIAILSTDEGIAAGIDLPLMDAERSPTGKEALHATIWLNAGAAFGPGSPGVIAISTKPLAP